MTNYFENLDIILSQYRLAYLNAYQRGDYITAAGVLYDRNSAHPPDAWLEDMPKFSVTGNSLKARLNMTAKAKNYCDYWNNRLEIAMSNFRKLNQAAYNML